jgi:hypothetical protein
VSVWQSFWEPIATFSEIHGFVNEAVFPGSCNHSETNARSYRRHRIALMERVMNTAIAHYLTRSSKKTAASFDSMISVAIFSGVGLLISLSVLIMDRYIPGDWF